MKFVVVVEVVEEEHSSCVVDGRHYNDGYHMIVNALQVVVGNGDSLVEDHKDDMYKEEDGGNFGHVGYGNMAWDTDNLEDKNDDDVSSYSYSSFLSCR
jgi:hypothetical protein